MIPQIRIILIMLLISVVGSAQTHSTKGVKVVLVVSSPSNSVSHVALFHAFRKLKGDAIAKKYGNSRFYLGKLRGNYHLDEQGIIPMVGAEVTIYTDKRFYPNEEPLIKEGLSIGGSISLGKEKAKVLSCTRGELVLVAQ